MRFLSIIIPIYNCEKYIARCLDSIFQSDIPRELYEVIVINDGSTDNGRIIVNQYLNIFDNIKYLEQINQGQGVARNYGINECSGEYIWFVDGDDMVVPNLYCLLQYIMSHPQIDIVGINMRYLTEEGDEIPCFQQKLKRNVIMSGRDVIIEGFESSSVCTLIVRHHFLNENNLRFCSGITHEDVELSYRMVVYAKTICFSDFVSYVYLIHKGSTSQAIIPEKQIKYICDDIEIVKSLNHLAQKFENRDAVLANIIKQRARNITFGTVFSLLQNKRKWKSIGLNSCVIKKMKSENLYPLKGPFNSIAKTILSWFLNIERVIN